jgi:hypothetical protein
MKPLDMRRRFALQVYGFFGPEQDGWTRDVHESLKDSVRTFAVTLLRKATPSIHQYFSRQDFLSLV